MKTLTNCTPHEFIAQTVKIKKVAADWLNATGILDIRDTRPKLIKLDDGMSDEERAAAIEENDKRTNKQTRENLTKMFEAAFEKYPEKTLEVLAAACFTPIAEIDNHSMSYYFGGLNEMLNDENVISFFTTLVGSGSRNG